MKGEGRWRKREGRCCWPNASPTAVANPRIAYRAPPFAYRPAFPRPSVPPFSRYPARLSRFAVYPGSFDPPTLGRLDVIERASKLLDRVVVAVGVNTSKNPLFTTDERMEALRRTVAPLSNVQVDRFEGLLVKYAKGLGADALVRGLRATADFEYEFQMAMVNRRLEGSLETVFLMTKWEPSYLSSSIVREVAQLGGDYSELVPAPVAEMVALALGRRA